EHVLRVVLVLAPAARPLVQRLALDRPVEEDAQVLAEERVRLARPGELDDRERRGRLEGSPRALRVAREPERMPESEARLSVGGALLEHVAERLHRRLALARIDPEERLRDHVAHLAAERARERLELE